ncbi:MAG TPA: hypothetical protein VHL54_07550 [Actinomycetota bacterium]|jgi:hypothetical protein|nr:hypothetical protein [Actinomycetota bacterium]
MEVLAAVVLGIAAGIFIKGVFLKDSSIVWDVVMGAAGGLVAWYLSGALSESIYSYVATLGTAVVIAGVLTGLVGRFNKTAV